MAAVESTMLELGTTAPDFSLESVNTPPVILHQRAVQKGVLVVFWCNHCPYVKHIRKEFVRLANSWMRDGIDVLAVMSNDTERYPDDAPEHMQKEAEVHRFPFPYLIDADQKTAHAYRAACTPDFYLFDAERRLVYRGQFDASRPRNDVPVTGDDINQAVQALLHGEVITERQAPSIGCNIKWKPGNEPDYFGIRG
jgi:peroxiredoxin